ncbi:hypothetical protein BDR26DRAFT_953618 [Obelidium mucronatum]|nr:hypothetical protein BDR26DRAFT_953618 [Obelidium mucronatum]
MDAAPAAEGFQPSELFKTSSLDLLRAPNIKPNLKYKHIPSKTISRRGSQADLEATKLQSINTSTAHRQQQDKKRTFPSKSSDQKSASEHRTSTLEKPDNSDAVLSSSYPETLTTHTESKAAEQYRLLSQVTADRAEHETTHLLTTAADHENHLAEQVANHLKGMQKFMATRLRTGGVFVDGGLVSLGTADRLVEAEKAKQKKEAEKKRVHQLELMEAELQQKAKIERQKKTGKGRRRLAVLEGGTGDIPVGFLTKRNDFRPLPVGSTDKKPSQDSGRVYDSMSLYEMLSKEDVDGLVANDENRAGEESEVDVMEALNNKLESMKLQLCQTTDRLEEQKRRKENPGTPPPTEERAQIVSASKKPSSKFVKVDSSASLLSRGVSAAIVRRTSGRGGPRVPLEVAAIWKAKEEGRFSQDHNDCIVSHIQAIPDPVAENLETKPKRLVPRRHAADSDFVSFSDSANILNLKQVLDVQNAKIDQLAEEVLGPYDTHVEETKPIAFIDPQFIASSAEEIILNPLQYEESDTTRSKPFQIDAVTEQFPSYDYRYEEEPLRKCDPPPEPVIFAFPHSSARLLDARNRRINPTSSSEIIQPRLPTNPQSLKIQSSIHNISQPPTLSASAYAASSKVAEACMKNQFKMAPTLSLMETGGGLKSNPVVDLPERKFVGKLEHVFGLSFEDLKLGSGANKRDSKSAHHSTVTDSVLSKLGVESKHAKVAKSGKK